MTLPVYIDPDLVDAEQVRLAGPEAHHAAVVRRTNVGERIDVVNGAGLRVTIEVDSVTKGEVRGRRVASVQEEPARPRLTLVQALAKRGHDEQALETCTEYGADAFVPWMAERSIVRWSGEKARKGQARLAEAVWAATKQSRRAYLPRVHPLHTSDQLAEAIARFDGLALVCHEEATTPLVDLLPIERDVMIVVGPEGGITPAELAAFQEAGAWAVALGRHVMRSATAGAWASAVVRAYR
ncbi:16S rRNA (uracil(1498)-N(3))-methyltransferase [Trueperella abortisuis]|uniref:16S rRNA (uracil(1498)-N(3))-methyltransferase n=1 Tax=Trueperella abortisuis TaxID=445930 RepID=UPI0028931857|nr:16S rRNA (uracil(1498)-N(3))-methyltransferase [Trueperella abortisuis]